MTEFTITKQTPWHSSIFDTQQAIIVRRNLEALSFLKNRELYDRELVRLLKLHENLPKFREGHPVVYMDDAKLLNPTVGTGFNMGKPKSPREKEALREWARVLESAYRKKIFIIKPFVDNACPASDSQACA